MSTAKQRRMQKKVVGRARDNSSMLTKVKSPPIVKSVPKKARRGERFKQQKTSDPRIGKSGVSSTMDLSNQVRAITVTVPVQDNTYWLLSLGYVTRAIEKGFLTTTVNYYDAFFAQLYLIGVLQKASTNAIPQTQELPYVLSALCQAMAQRAINFGTGKIKYAFSNVSAAEPLAELQIGANVYGKYWTALGASETVFINDFPVVQSSLPVAYTELLGASAFQELNTFMAKNGGIDDPYRMVPFGKPTSLRRDVSAFAKMLTTVGLGAGGVQAGGFGAISFSEVPIFRPILSVLNSNYDPPNDANRYNVCPVATAGDPVMLGALLGPLFKEQDWGSPRYPKFHCVDFLEFGDVVAQWVVSITNSYLQDANLVTQTPDMLATLVCKLTLQEMLLVLRSVIMAAFKDTQSGVQGLYPFIPSSQTDNQFCPYTAGSGTCYLSGSDMILPVPLIENIRSLCARHIEKRTGEAEWFIPVLGQWALETLNPSDYVAVYNAPDGAQTQLPVFKVNTNMFRVKKFDEKTQTMKPSVVPEVPISLIDGAYSGGFVCINDPKQLKTLTMYWNDWIKATGLLSFSTKTTTLGTEPGINALCSISWTRYKTVFSEAQKLRKAEITDLRKEDARYKKSERTVFSTWQAVAESSQGIILSAPYEQVIKNWILPVVAVEYSGEFNDTVSQRWQSLMVEPFLSNLSTGTDGIVLSEMHSIYASMMTKAKLADADTWSDFFQEMSSKGRGGILSGLVASLISNVFPAASGIVTTIADVLPV